MKSALLSGQVDFVFYGSFAENDLNVSPLKCVNLATYDKELWCRAGNRFSQGEYVSMDELREENFVILDPYKHAAWAEQFNSMCSRAGFVPKIAASVDDILSLPMNLSTDDRIFIADGGVDINAGEYNLAKVKIANETSGTVLAWNSQHEKPEYFQFLDVSQKFFSNKYS